MTWNRRILGASCALWTGALLWAAPAGEATFPSPASLLKKARVDGKYAMLLRQVKVLADRERYGDFHDLGEKRPASVPAVEADEPEALFWVYAAPYWFGWRDEIAAGRPAKRPYGPEQACGPPDTPRAGDISTAWASLGADDRDEWLLLEYDEPLTPTMLLVHETFNPGALVRVTAFKLTGEEIEVWKGKDPTRPGQAMGVSEIPMRLRFKTNRIRLHLASKDVPGWNEIDAVGLKDSNGKTHWASSAAASSTYADRMQRAALAPPPLPPPAVPVAIVPPPQLAADPNAKRLDKLEEEIKQLRKELQELRDLLKSKK